MNKPPHIIAYQAESVGEPGGRVHHCTMFFRGWRLEAGSRRKQREKKACMNVFFSSQSQPKAQLSLHAARSNHDNNNINKKYGLTLLTIITYYSFIIRSLEG
jgi:hypothetical protein